MKNSLRIFCAALALAAIVPAASATVLSFDDLGGDGPVAANYGGLDWSAGDWFVYSYPQDPYTPHSGDFRATVGFGDTDANTEIRFGANTTFQGAWFSGFADATVTFQMYYQGNLVATSATLDPSATPEFLASGYAGLVDELIISSPDQSDYTMDDFTFAQAVPEPETYALMLAGLGAVGLVARRRRHA
jgi:opacity protein-like surface antigen